MHLESKKAQSCAQGFNVTAKGTDSSNYMTKKEISQYT